MPRLGYSLRKTRGKPHCPFHEDKTPSFSVRQDKGRWYWKCWAGCGAGDEVAFIERALGVDNGEAIKQYAKLAGVNGFMTEGQFLAEAAAIMNARPPAPEEKKVKKLPSSSAAPIKEFKPLSDKGVIQVNKWRGYKSDIVSKLAEAGEIGMYGNQIAFRTFGGYHVRNKATGDWWYTKGCKASLFVIGQLEEGALVHAFESQWDAIAFADVTGYRDNIVATRGSGNIRLLDRFLNFSGTLYLWPQNDEPGQKWARATAHDVNCQIKICPTPEVFKDFNDWLKGTKEPEGFPPVTMEDVQFAMTVQSEDVPDMNFDPPYRVDKDFPVGSSALQAVGALPEPEPPASADLQAEQSPAHCSGDLTPVSPDGNTVNGVSGESTALSGENDLNQSVASAAEPSKAQAEEVMTGTPPMEPAESPVQPPTGEVAPVISPEPGQPGAPETRLGGHLMALGQTLDLTVEYLERFIKFPMRAQADVIALWVAHTYVYRAWEYTPYLHIFSPEKNCGKTNLLKVIQHVCYNPLKFESSSLAAFFRKVDELKPTLLWDEVDNLFKNEKDNRELIGLLNGGYEAGAKAMRCSEGKSHEVEEYDAFCPKVFTGIGTIPDTLHSRSIDIKLVRQLSKDKADKVRTKYIKPYSQPLREAFAAWAKRAVEDIGNNHVLFPKEIDDGRLEDITEPLLAIADDAGGEWSDRARASLVQVVSTVEDMSQGIRLLEDVRMIFSTMSLDRMTSHGLLDNLIKVESADSKWPSMWERDIKNGAYQRPAQKLAEMLSPYEIKPTNVRYNDEHGQPAQGKGYYKAQFHDAWNRYLDEEGELGTAELALKL